MDGLLEGGAWMLLLTGEPHRAAVQPRAGWCEAKWTFASAFVPRRSAQVHLPHP